MVCQALEAYQAGRSTLAITGQGSELIAKLYELRQSAPDLDFEAVARREGKRVLRQTLARNPDAAVFSADQIEASLTEIVSWPLGALAHITQIERALAN